MHAIIKRFESPDETREFEKGRFDVVKMGAWRSRTPSGSSSTAQQHGRGMADGEGLRLGFVNRPEETG